MVRSSKVTIVVSFFKVIQISTWEQLNAEIGDTVFEVFGEWA